MKRLPQSSVQLWNQSAQFPRPGLPFLILGAGATLFMVGVNLGRMLYRLVQSG
ncbi:MAG: hypothetical protein JWQ08_1976 [Deinococcus sp.]|nr:hypothetical protein [Deinococcus sp.]